MSKMYALLNKWMKNPNYADAVKYRLILDAKTGMAISAKRVGKCPCKDALKHDAICPHCFPRVCAFCEFKSGILCKLTDDKLVKGDDAGCDAWELDACILSEHIKTHLLHYGKCQSCGQTVFYQDGQIRCENVHCKASHYWWQAGGELNCI